MRNVSGVVPPLSQSRQADMACQCLYIRKHVIRGPMAESEAAARGTAVHQILATYINHLVKTGRSTDLGFLDCMTTGSGNSEVVQALERFRDNHAFNPEQVLGTELYISLDEGFKPIEPMSFRGRDHGRAEHPPAAHEGTLDLVLLSSITEAEIHDWKSYYQIIDPDTFQAKFYPLLLMCLNPSLQRVKFVLEFIRYGASRSVEYTRQDLSWLKELAERERARQLKLHEVAGCGTGVQSFSRLGRGAIDLYESEVCYGDGLESKLRQPTLATLVSPKIGLGIPPMPLPPTILQPAKTVAALRIVHC